MDGNGFSGLGDQKFRSLGSWEAGDKMNMLSKSAGLKSLNFNRSTGLGYLPLWYYVKGII